MRRLLLVFMIALLPLRALVGDAMVMAMTAVPAAHDTNAAGMGNLPCPEHTAAALPGQDAAHGSEHHAETHGHDADDQHAVCDLCNGPAMTHAMLAPTPLPAEHGLDVAPVARFASSEPHRGIKPPIS
ncbi:hypothetical protein J2W49_005075 [Hydrogenophaga palleronii]|uniref:DUF2946 domain-containing protein n=1 Tax=Hydrogenophaga palleronii TaxID=65655 RepID=A0ABU1WUY0_9BURK|nr:hypothetical protein [Hydrogenophaga palleronii]MDR7153095.1 hypothetical protein [Hydrogenophaga palleronii]